MKSDPPTRDDFLSDKEAGKRQPPPPNADLWEGMSLYELDSQAKAVILDIRSKFGAKARIGGYIAEVEIPDNGPILYARTQPQLPGHFTIRGDADLLLAVVRSVVRV